MVVLSVANSVNMSVFQRTGEFGTMMALGNRTGAVYRLIVTESALLGMIGGGVGVIIGIAAGVAISAVGIPMPPPPNANLGYTAHIQLIPSDILMAFAAGLFATVLAAVWPAARVSRTPVVDALRANI
jgi:putative ABC transport system permease protein